MPKKVFLLSFFSFLICLLLAMPTLADGSPWIGSGEGSKIESGSSKNSAQELNEMLRGFEQGCSVVSNQLNEVYSAVNTIKSAISSVKNSKNCENLNEVMIELNSKTLEAKSLYPSEFDNPNSNLEITIKGLEGRKKDLFFMLSQAEDPEEIKILKDDLRNVTLELRQYEGESAAYEYNDKQIRKAKAFNILSQNTYRALNTLLDNQKCIAEHPELLKIISGVSLGVGASLSEISPVGAAASVFGWGAGMVGGLIQYFEEKSEQKKLMSFDVDQLPVTMTCTIEKFNQMYCSAEETLIAIDKYKKYHDLSKSTKKDPIILGANVVNKSVPVALDWLQKIKNGSNPSNSADAIKFNNIDEIELALLKGLRAVEGGVEEVIYNPIASRESQWLDLRKLVNKVAPFTCPNPFASTPTPSFNTICEFKSFDSLRFYLIGITSQRTYDYLKSLYPFNSFIFDEFTSISALEQKLIECRDKCDNEAVSLDPRSVLIRYRELLQLGKERFDLIKQRDGQGDLSVVFASAKGISQSQAEYNEKPIHAFQKIVRFLQNRPESMKSQNLTGKKLINETINSLQIIIDNINCVNNETCDLFAARRNIINASEISTDSSKLSNRIRYLIKSYVDYSVYENTIEQEDQWYTQYKASDDLLSDINVLYKSNGSNLDLETKLLIAQSSISNALKNFQKNYSSVLKTTFEALNKNISQDPRANKRIKEVLCYQTLGLKWEDTFKTCLGIEAQPLLGSGKKAPKITRELYNQERRVKSCVYRNFSRLNRLDEKRSKNKGFR